MRTGVINAFICMLLTLVIW